MMKVSENIPGYAFGSPEISQSTVSVAELQDLKVSVGFTEEDERYLQLAGNVLADQVEHVVERWRGDIIVSIPNLARHSRTYDGKLIPEYLARSNLRFQQWILDTCLRPYDQDWINYQQEIALRHTAAKKNLTDGVQSTLYVPLRDIIAFIAVMNITIKPYLGAKGHSTEEVEKMHEAWCRSVQLQLTLWIGPFSDVGRAPREW